MNNLEKLKFIFSYALAPRPIEFLQYKSATQEKLNSSNAAWDKNL